MPERQLRQAGLRLSTCVPQACFQGLGRLAARCVWRAATPPPQDRHHARCALQVTQHLTLALSQQVHAKYALRDIME